MSGSQWQCGRAVTAATLRECREVLEISQAALAAELGVSPETYRVWDSGRRPPPARILDRARAFVGHRNDQALLPLGVLATMIGVHVRTLRNAARDGRLAVTYDTRTTFRRLRARASTHYRAATFPLGLNPVSVGGRPMMNQMVSSGSRSNLTVAALISGYGTYVYSFVV